MGRAQSRCWRGDSIIGPIILVLVFFFMLYPVRVPHPPVKGLEDICGKGKTGPFPGNTYLCDVFTRKRSDGQRYGTADDVCNFAWRYHEQ